MRSNRLHSHGTLSQCLVHVRNGNEAVPGVQLGAQQQEDESTESENQTGREESCVFKEVRSTLEVIHMLTGICIFAFIRSSDPYRILCISADVSYIVHACSSRGAFVRY
jgi:hypothetical protein